jgi:4-diphosphocytidyl-2-C-methyl-D-erythritol kinase
MTSGSISLPSFAKLNLGLSLAGRRSDGYHQLCTIFQTVSLADEISFAPADDLRLTCSDPRIPVDAGNLIIKAALTLQERFAIRSGASIHLTKRIPTAGGLGGGSSNAAVALLGLTKLWELQADAEQLHDFAVTLGSDVPYFLVGGTALGTGRGTEIEPLPEIEAKQLLIVTPDVSVSTREAFNRLAKRNLTSDEVNRILLNYRLAAGSGDLRTTALANDFEETVFATYPEIGSAKQKLLELGAVDAALSGSGASVFGIFDNEGTRQAAQKALGNEANWRSFAVATLSRNEYREALKDVL